MESIKESIQHIIQLHMNNIDEQQRICSSLVKKDYNQFLSKLIQIAQETKKTITNDQIKSNYSHKDFYTKKLLAISQVFNRQITFIFKSNKSKSYQKILKDLSNFLATSSKGEYQIIQNYIQPLWGSLELLLQNCSDYCITQIVQTFHQNFQDKQKIESIFYKVFLNSVQNIQIITKQGLKMIGKFTDRFFGNFEVLVNKLAFVQTEKEGIDLVSQRVQIWSMFLGLLTKLLQRLYEYEEQCQQILQELKRKKFHNIINEILKIDQTLKIKPPLQEQQSGEFLGLGFLVSCKYYEFNQNLNILKKNATSVINFFLRNLYYQECQYFQITVQILNQNLYQQIVGDLCIISRQYLHFKSIHYLYSGQYSLINNLYELLYLSISIPVLKDRLFYGIEETIGWQNFLLFVCVVNIKLFSYLMFQDHQNQNNTKNLYGNEKNTLQQKNEQQFVTDLFLHIVQQKQQWKDPLISFCTQITIHLIFSNSKTLRKILSKFGIKPEPLLQQFLQNPENLNIWFHIINLLIIQQCKVRNIQLLKLLKTASDQLIYCQIQGFKQFLKLYLNISPILMSDQVGKQIIDKLLENIFQLVRNLHLQDKRTQIVFLFLTKFMIRNGCFSSNYNAEILFDLCFRKIEMHFKMVQSIIKMNNYRKQGKDLKIFLNFMAKYMQVDFSQKCIKKDVMNVLIRVQQILTQLLRCLSNNLSKLSEKQRQLVCKLINALLRNVFNITDCQSKNNDIYFKFSKLIDSIIDFLFRTTQVHRAYFSSIKLLLSLSRQQGSLLQRLANHILHVVKEIFKNGQVQKKISSIQLKSIIQILFIISVRINQIRYNPELWQDVCISTIKQSKNKFITQQDIKKQQRLSQSPRKFIVKNRIRLQIQAFKLTIFLLSNHCKKVHQRQKIIHKFSCSKNEKFLEFLHSTISLSNQLDSFEAFLKFEDLAMISYAVDDYIKYMSFEERRKFLVQIMMLLSETKQQEQDKKINKNLSYLPFKFNPVSIIRSHSFDLLFQIERLLKDESILPKIRQQNQRYHYAIRVLLKKLQSLTVVECQKRQILKVKQKDQEANKVQNQELII